jgi:hypothetical protein
MGVMVATEGKEQKVRIGPQISAALIARTDLVMVATVAVVVEAAME